MRANRVHVLYSTLLDFKRDYQVTGKKVPAQRSVTSKQNSFNFTLKINATLTAISQLVHSDCGGQQQGHSWFSAIIAKL